MLFWIAQIVGFASFIFYILSYQYKKKVGIAISTLAAQILSLVQYALLGGFAGSVVKIFSIIRSILVIDKEELHFKNSIPIITITVIMVGLAFFYPQSFLSSLVILTAAGFNLVWWFASDQGVRSYAILGALVGAAYDISIGCAFGLCTDIAACLSAAIALLRYRKQTKQAKQAKLTPAINDEPIEAKQAEDDQPDSNDQA